ncbi:ABC transporter substrate-binding protein [Phenylobacterium sp.]|uniref:ABC transporter substrate-binding protein n=1 Tax=Phenylobacterium sp. TaxID=1871053 RepID=UPI002C198FE8|nr:ABC transporter substrate-binding protein [Phenylobacterium sp.]HLZ74094.1 ABC transporter substrate-binding protein [Phenylobacterium sp.]
MAGPRILSLLPSATEIAVAVGRGEGLVGRSHECDFPAFVEALPVCTATKLEKGLTSRQIEDRVQEIVRQGLSVYEVKAALVRALKPDVVLTQSQCAVCAVTPADLEEALCDWVGAPPTLLSLAPDNLDDVWADLRRVGAAVDAAGEAEAAVGRLQAGLEAIRVRGAARGWRPRVAAIEWIEPLMAAGNWVPELIDAAGGEALFAAPGQHSPWLEWDALAAADPDVIILMPCGYRIGQTLAEMGALRARPEWRDLSAVRAGRVFAVDGHHYFNRPGPRLVESAEIVAEILDRCVDARSLVAGPVGERWRVAAVA